MTKIAAIDAGSNALRLAIAEVGGDRRLTIVESLRESVRLGQDVFTGGAIAEATMENAVGAFQRFQQAIARHGVSRLRAVATSATREAVNRELFLDRISSEAGIELEIIGPEEEARLIHVAVASRIGLKNKLALLIDIGGGSTEITFASDDTILSTESFRIGAVRLLQVLEERKHGEPRFNRLLAEYLEAVRKRIARDIGDRTFDLAAGTGGNIDTLGDLRADLPGRGKDGALTTADLDELIKRLQDMSFERRVKELGLRPDRADVIIPAAFVLRTILRAARVAEVQVPKVGLKDGLLLDLMEELAGGPRVPRRDQVIASAMALGRKYRFDEPHAVAVAGYAVSLFDQTRKLHNLGIEYRLLLEVAGLLHDIGSFISASEHHKHTFYLLMNSPVVGLSQQNMALVANAARYHRKSFPKVQHEGYKVLSSRDRVVVTKLAALLRVADAMDNEHASKVKDFTVEFKKPKLTISLHGEGDLLLEKWALIKKAELFEEVFSVKIVIEE